MRKIFGHHWTLKRDQPNRIRKVGQKRREIAVADEYFGMGFDLVQIQEIQKIVGTVPSARANNGPHLVAYKHLFQLASTSLRRSGKVKILVKNRIEIEGLISHAA